MKMRIIGMTVAVVLGIAAPAAAQDRPEVTRESCAASFSERLQDARRTIVAHQQNPDRPLRPSRNAEDEACFRYDVQERVPLVITSGNATLQLLVMCYGSDRGSCDASREVRERTLAQLRERYPVDYE